MRIENPTFALTPTPVEAVNPAVATADPSPDVTRTQPPAAGQPGTTDKTALVDGAAGSDVVYLRGWRIRKLWIWQGLALLCLVLFVVFGK